MHNFRVVQCIWQLHCVMLMSMERKLPQLPPDIDLLNPDDPITEEEVKGFDPWKPVKLSCVYRVELFRVKIGWTFGLPMGDFREPEAIEVSYDAEALAAKYDKQSGSAKEEPLGLGGLTTKILRKLPTVHAQALMRDHYESLGVAEAKRILSPLPARVVEDHEYVHIATAYVALTSTSLEPVRRLAEWSGEKPDTWFARLKRARAKGILQGTGQNARISPAFQEASNQLWRTKTLGGETQNGSQETD